MAKSIKGTSTKKAAGAQVGNSEETALRELFVDEIRDTYGAEKQITKVLPRLKKAATSEELAAAFEEHLTVTQVQIERLEQVFELLEVKVRAVKCEGIEGIVSESEKVIADTQKGSSTRDAGLIMAAQKVEHYEIASYGSLVQLAKTMGRQDIADLMQLTLDEEKQADQILTDLAVSSVNINADTEPAEGSEDE